MWWWTKAIAGALAYAVGCALFAALLVIVGGAVLVIAYNQLLYLESEPTIPLDEAFDGTYGSIVSAIIMLASTVTFFSMVVSGLQLARWESRRCGDLDREAPLA